MEISELSCEDWDLIIRSCSSDLLRILGSDTLFQIKSFYVGTKRTLFDCEFMVSHAHFNIKSSLEIPFKSIPIRLGYGELSDVVLRFRLEVGK